MTTEPKASEIPPQDPLEIPPEGISTGYEALDLLIKGSAPIYADHPSPAGYPKGRITQVWSSGPELSTFTFESATRAADRGHPVLIVDWEGFFEELPPGVQLTSPKTLEEGLEKAIEFLEHQAIAADQDPNYKGGLILFHCPTAAVCAYVTDYAYMKDSASTKQESPWIGSTGLLWANFMTSVSAKRILHRSNTAMVGLFEARPAFTFTPSGSTPASPSAWGFYAVLRFIIGLSPDGLKALIRKSRYSDAGGTSAVIDTSPIFQSDQDEIQERWGK